MSDFPSIGSSGLVGSIEWFASEKMEPFIYNVMHTNGPRRITLRDPSSRRFEIYLRGVHDFHD